MERRAWRATSAMVYKLLSPKMAAKPHLVVLAELLDEGRLMGSADARCLPPVPLIKISTFLFASARAAASTTSPIPIKFTKRFNKCKC